MDSSVLIYYFYFIIMYSVSWFGSSFFSFSLWKWISLLFSWHIFDLVSTNLRIKNVYTKLLSDKIAVWAKAGLDWYKGFGNDVSKCIITGKPGHDLLYLRRKNYRKESKEIFLKIGEILVDLLWAYAHNIYMWLMRIWDMALTNSYKLFEKQ